MINGFARFPFYPLFGFDLFGLGVKRLAAIFCISSKAIPMPIKVAEKIYYN
jgi:hypothetical protein